MEHSTSDSKKIIGALLVGTAVGVVIGILFAPAKGSETRKTIADKSGDFTDLMKEKFNEFMEGVKKESVAVKEHVKNHVADHEHASKESSRAK